jgi:pimeloyl-ACP methyl ester carboxylesterase
LTESDLGKMNDKIKNGDNSKQLYRQKMRFDLMAKHPNIPTKELSKIKIPVLIMSADDDLIKAEHIMEIYRSIPNSNLVVLPGATHFALHQDPEIFNYMADRFLTHPFKRPTSRAVIESFYTVK